MTDGRILLASALLLIVIPPLVFTSVALTSGMALTETAAALGAQHTAPRVNLAVCSALGLVPLLLLAFILWIRRRYRPSAEGPPLYAIGGALPILAVAAFVNLEYWTVFLPNRTFLGFPHGLEFIIGPGVFAPVGKILMDADPGVRAGLFVYRIAQLNVFYPWRPEKQGPKRGTVTFLVTSGPRGRLASSNPE